MPYPIGNWNSIAIDVSLKSHWDEKLGFAPYSTKYDRFDIVQNGLDGKSLFSTKTLRHKGEMENKLLFSYWIKGISKINRRKFHTSQNLLR